MAKYASDIRKKKAIRNDIIPATILIIMLTTSIPIEQAKTDKRRNLLLQCIGASDKVEPQIIKGRIAEGVYMLCSDGFRHEITSEEIYTHFKPSKLKNKESMHANARTLIDENKKRQEKDNISVVLIKVYQEDWQ